MLMNNESKLAVIKSAHTVIWVFFNGVIGYMLYAVLTNKLDYLLWICYGLVATEGLVLLIFRWCCPLTILARRYSTSTKDNFDIYLPEWLAKHTKRIYTTITFIILFLTIYRLLQPVAM